MRWLAQHPLPFLLLSWAAFTLLTRYIRVPTFSERTLTAAAVATITAYVAVMGWYCTRLAYEDAAEAAVAGIAAAFLHGQPLYPPFESADQYAHVYGPMLFLVHAAALYLAGATIATTKLVGALALACALALFGRVYIASSGRAPGVIALGIVVGAFASFSNIAYWGRPEPLMILCVAVALAASRTRSLAGDLAVGLAAGVAVNLKITGLFYVAPAAAVAMIRTPSAALTIAATAIVTAAAPFASDRISAHWLGEYLRMSASNGVLWSNLKQNLEWALVFTVVLLPAMTHIRRAVMADRLFVGVLAASLGAVVITAAKPGSGAYHLLPFVPLIAYAVLRLDTFRYPSTVIALTFTLVCWALPGQLRFVEVMRNRDLSGPIAEVHAFADAHPSERWAVGYAGTDYASQAFVIAAFRTGVLSLEALSVQELRLAGRQLPRATYDALQTCRERHWLIPRTGNPFDVPSGYHPFGPPNVFPEDFQRTFRAHYTLTTSLRFFDVWSCATNSRVRAQ